jgi:hypothetical protein
MDNTLTPPQTKAKEGRTSLKLGITGKYSEPRARK